MKIALLAALLIVTGCATAPPKAPAPADLHEFLIGLMRTPQSTSEWKTFDALHEAALYGAKRLADCSVYYECSGQIYKHDGKFVNSPVHTDYAANHVSIHDDQPTGWELAADLHSHPCAPPNVTRVFSPEDMIGAIIERVPASFMVDLCTGDVHEFIPNKTRIDVEKVDDDVWLSQGEIIGHIAPAKMPLANEGI
jgi:hypothetical protein